MKKCAHCGKEIVKSRFSPISKKYCSNTCRWRADNEKRTDKPKVKDCDFCGKQFTPYTSLDKFCSSACRVNAGKSKRTRNWTADKAANMKGKNNPSFKHGQRSAGSRLTGIGQRLFEKHRDERKQEIIDADGHLHCEHCGASNGKLEGHHIIYRSEKPGHEHLHDKANILMLCVSCHNKYHNTKGIRDAVVNHRRLDLLFGHDVLNKLKL